MKIKFQSLSLTDSYLKRLYHLMMMTSLCLIIWGIPHYAQGQRTNVKTVSLASMDPHQDGGQGVFRPPYQKCFGLGASIEFVIPKITYGTKHDYTPSLATYSSNLKEYRFYYLKNTPSVRMRDDILIEARNPLVLFDGQQQPPTGICIARDEDDFFFYIKILNQSNTTTDLLKVTLDWDKSNTTPLQPQSIGSCGLPIQKEILPTGDSWDKGMWVAKDEPWRISTNYSTTLCLDFCRECRREYPTYAIGVNVGALSLLQAASPSFPKNTDIGISYTSPVKGTFYTESSLMYLNRSDELDNMIFSRNYIEFTPLRVRAKILPSLSIGVGPNIRMLGNARLGERVTATLSERFDNNLRRFTSGISGDVILRLAKNRINIGLQATYQQGGYRPWEGGIEWRPMLRINL